MNLAAKKLIHDAPRIILYSIFYIFYGLSFFFPRSKRIWVFDEWEGMRCADNARYLFLYIHERQPDVYGVWIAHSRPLIAELKNQGLRAYYAYSLPGLWYTLRAKVIVFESTMSVFFWLTGGIIKINLWHGLPIKKIVYDSVTTKRNNWVYASSGLKRFYHVFLQPEKVMLGDYVLSQSKVWKDFFSSAFRVDPSHVIVENQPRNEAIISHITLILKTEQQVLERIFALQKTKKIVTYLPTFRDGSDNPLKESRLDFASLDAFLGEHSLHMFIKMHHEKVLTKEQGKYANIDLLPVDFGVMLLLRYTDILMTDYSSVFFEFLLADRPVIFFAFDLGEYVSGMRELYFNYDEITPGPKARTVEELYRYLTEAVEGHDPYKEMRGKIREMILNPDPDKSSEKVFYKIQEIIHV